MSIKPIEVDKGLKRSTKVNLGAQRSTEVLKGWQRSTKRSIEVHKGQQRTTKGTESILKLDSIFLQDINWKIENNKTIFQTNACNCTSKGIFPLLTANFNNQNIKIIFAKELKKNFANVFLVWCNFVKLARNCYDWIFENIWKIWIPIEYRYRHLTCITLCELKLLVNIHCKNYNLFYSQRNGHFTHSKWGKRCFWFFKLFFIIQKYILKSNFQNK